MNTEASRLRNTTTMLNFAGTSFSIDAVRDVVFAKKNETIPKRGALRKFEDDASSVLGEEQSSLRTYRRMRGRGA